VQLDEKWAFVGKKQAHCDPDDPADAQRGDHWDHVALDAEHRLVLCVVAGKRTEANTLALVRQVRQRLGGRLPALITSEEYRPYKAALLEVYGETVCPPRTGRRGRPRRPYNVPPPALHYGAVHKTRRNGRVVRVEERVLFGDPDAVRARLARSAVSRHINTAFLERQNGTDRNRNAQGAPHLLFLESLGHAGGGHLLHHVQLQFLPARPDAARPRSRGPPARAHPGAGRRVDRSCLVAERVADLSRYATSPSHKGRDEVS